MSRPRQAQSAPVDIPYRGMSTRYPLAKMPPQFCPWLEGYRLGAGFLESPKGLRYMFAGEAGPVGAFAADPGNAAEIVQFSQAGLLTARAWNVYSEANGSTDTGGTGIGARFHTLAFGDNIIVFQTGAAPNIWDGTNLSAMSFTGPTLASVCGGTSYNRQLYVFTGQSTSVWFRDSIGAITGAFTEYDTNLISKHRGYVMSVFTFTLSSGLDSQHLFGIALDSGEMIVATGFDPADTATWQVIGRAMVGRPLGYNNYIEKDGDVLLLTTTGIVSVRAMLLGRQEQDEAGAFVTDEIEKYWQQLVRDLDEYQGATTYAPEGALTSYIRGVWHQQENRLYIFTPRRLEPFQSSDGDFGYNLVAGTTILIYDFNYQGWTVRGFNSVSQVPGNEGSQICAAYYEPRKGDIYIATNAAATNAVWKISGNTRFSDNISAPSTTTTSATFADSTAENEINAASVSWTNPTNALTSDDTYATSALSGEFYTKTLYAKDFDLAIPAGATITAITPSIEWKASSATPGVLMYSFLSKTAGSTTAGLVLNDTYLGGGSTPTTDTSTACEHAGYYGFSWTADELNSEDFAVGFAFVSTIPLTFSIDTISVTITYIADISANDANIPLKVISAPLALTDKQQHVKAWKVQQSGDTYAKQALTMQSQGDISNQISGATSNGSLQAGVSTDLYNAGIAADLIQYVLETATTKDDDRSHKVLRVSPVLEVGGEIG